MQYYAFRLKRVQEQLQRALGERIRQLRLKQGYSQESFADHCGVHRTFMGTVERGESNLSLYNTFRIASALGITMAQLLKGVEERAQKLAKSA